MTSALNLGNPSFRSDQDGVTPYEGIWDGIVVTASGRARTLALRPVRSLRSTSTARYQVALHIRAHMHGGTVELRLTGWLNRTAGGGRHPVEAQPYLDSARPRFLRKLFS